LLNTLDVSPTAIDDLKVGDIFESRIKLLQAFSEWSIVHSVSFKPVKTNKTCYTAICGADDVSGGKECLRRIHVSVPKKIKWILQDYKLV